MAGYRAFVRQSTAGDRQSFDDKEPQMVTAAVILAFIISIVLVLVAIAQIDA